MSEEINKNFKGLYDTSKTTFITDRTEPTRFYEPEVKTPRIKNVSYSINFDKKELYKQIDDLQQKVKQLENENEYLKMSTPEQNMEHFRIVNENKRKIDMLRKENHQLEKEVNKYQKELEKADSIIQSCIFQGKQESKISFRKCLNRLEQLENIRKEAIEYMKEFIFEPLLINEDRKLIMFNENLKNFENILNKGE